MKNRNVLPVAVKCEDENNSFNANFKHPVTRSQFADCEMCKLKKRLALQEGPIQSIKTTAEKKSYELKHVKC